MGQGFFSILTIVPLGTRLAETEPTARVGCRLGGLRAEAVQTRRQYPWHRTSAGAGMGGSGKLGVVAEK